MNLLGIKQCRDEVGKDYMMYIYYNSIKKSHPERITDNNGYMRRIKEIVDKSEKKQRTQLYDLDIDGRPEIEEAKINVKFGAMGVWPRSYRISQIEQQ